MCRTACGDAVRLRMANPAERNEPVGTCTHLSRLKGGGFAIKASGSWPRVRLKLVVAAGFEPALAALSTPCLFQLGYATVV
jgi:hypothetical protein